MEKRVSEREVEAVVASMTSSIFLAWAVVAAKKVEPRRRRLSRQHNS